MCVCVFGYFQFTFLNFLILSLFFFLIFLHNIFTTVFKQNQKELLMVFYALCGSVWYGEEKDEKLI